jgi:ABC-type bacteriocin/lantibiotic exporter with double-glycine peptidase domain
MIARHHGLDYPLSKFRAITNTNRSGVNLHGLVTGAKAIGLAAEALTGTREDLLTAIESGHVKLPFIAHIHKMAMLHFVVVCEYREGVLTIADPASGLDRLTVEEFNELWTGFVVSFSFDPLN